MTTGIITIQDFVQREIIYCVSTLIDDLKNQGCLDLETAIALYSGPIDYEAAKYELEQNDDKPWLMFCQSDGEHYWGIKNFH